MVSPVFDLVKSFIVQGLCHDEDSDFVKILQLDFIRIKLVDQANDSDEPPALIPLVGPKWSDETKLISNRNAATSKRTRDVNDEAFSFDNIFLNLVEKWSYKLFGFLIVSAPGISASPSEDNMRYFNVMILGPSQSPYEGGVFKLELFLTEEYPMAAPKVRFLTKIYHPNIDKLGRICLDILKDKWSPALQIRTVLLSIQALLSAPNPDDPLSENIAKHWKTNEVEAVETAKEWTRLYASGA
ncbi:hypothetical protein RD792_006743 [Penstemon davidsonii]|nr:hypothetical protein RD792_006743 [Penstemon davidsonii]